MMYKLQPTDVTDVKADIQFMCMFLHNGSMSTTSSSLAKMCTDSLSLPSSEEGQLIYLTLFNVSDLLTLKRTDMNICLTGTWKNVGVWVI